MNPSPHVFRAVAAALVLSAAWAAGSGSAAAQAPDKNRYQIERATADRVWRLDKQTGEIAVCTLKGENLFCTTTTEAVAAPKMTYAEWQAKQKAEKDKHEAAQAREQERQLAMFDRIMAFIRSLMADSTAK